MYGPAATPALVEQASPLAPLSPSRPKRGRLGYKAHLVGIAGSGMRSLAEVLCGWGWRVSGSDAVLTPDCGFAPHVRTFCGHSPTQVPADADLVIHSDAIPPGNPELRRAAELGIPTCSYARAVGKLMVGRRGLAVAGTHGKSTTTAMAARVLVEAGLDPTVVCGAAPLGKAGGGRAGRGPLMLVEACEYRSNFLHLRSHKAAILGIEPDHFDCFPSMAKLEAAFTRFAASVPSEGLLLARHDCSATRRAAAGAKCAVETFGLDPAADWSAGDLAEVGGHYAFTIHYRQGPICRVRLRTPGEFNVLNALAAAALAWHEGAGSETIARGLGRFAGLCRRLEVLGTRSGVTLVDDYAHHPTEVAASLEALRGMFPGRRLWCVFQPHQASRTRHLLDELAASLQNADKVVVAEIYRAREPAPAPGDISAVDLARAVRRLGGDVADVYEPAAIAERVGDELRPGDVLVTMGAGDIRKIVDGIVGRL